jgi:hypothetical protein
MGEPMAKSKANMSFGVTIDVSPLNKLVDGLKGFEKEIPGATASALNRTLEYISNRMGKIVVENYSVKEKEVKASIKNHMTKASKGDISASIESVGHRLSFAHFPFNPKKPVKAKRSIFQKAVMVDIKKKRVLSRRGFVATTGAKSQEKTQYNVFMRIGEKRFQIAPIRTLSIPQMITNEKTSEEITEMANKKLAERVYHEIDFRLKKIQEKLKEG